MEPISLERPSLSQKAIVFAATLAALAVLALVLAYWTRVLIAPPVPHASVAAAPAGGLAAASALFGNVRRDGGEAAPTGMAIALLGVVAASGGEPGYAVLKLDDKKILAVREGADIAPGVRLAEIDPDHVVLQRGARRETLAWPKKARAAGSPAHAEH